MKKINKKFLCHLLYELDENKREYEYGIENKMPFFTSAYTMPMVQAKLKIQSFKVYFEKLGIPFPDLEQYPGKLAIFGNALRQKEKEYIFKNEKVIIKYPSLV